LNADSGIWTDSLSKVYRSGGADVVVFKDLSLQVRRGERVAVIGESGAGKSTLLHLLGGLERPTAGRIWFGRRDITSLGESALAEFRNRELGFVWQNPSLLAEFTALENVMMPLLIRGVAPEQAAGTARARLREVGLEARALHGAGELSGGEQQRVAIARALVGEPKVLLTDEPTGNLDFRTGETIVNLLEQLHASHDLTSVFVTHNLEFAARCDRVLELRNGALETASLMKAPEPERLQDAARLGGGTYV